MALARTAQIQAITGTSGNFGTGNFTTGSFTPPDSSLLVVAVGLVENNGSTTDPSTAITLSGGSLTWTARIAIASSPTSFPTGIRVFTAPVTTGTSMTLTAGSGGRAAGMYAVSAVAYTGYDTGTPTGATASGQQNGGFSGPPTPASLTLSGAPSTTSESFAAVAMDKSVIGVTPGSSPTTWTEIHDTMQNTDWGGLETEVRTASTSTSVSWDDLRSGGGALFNFAAVALEIRAAPAGGPAFPPSRQARRLLDALPQLARPRGRIATPVRAQVNPPFPFTGVKQPRELRGLLPRRGRAAAPVPAQVVVTAPKFPPAAVRPRLKGLRLFRGHAASPPIDQPGSAGQTQRQRPRLPRIFRGRAVQPVSPQTAVAAPAYPPQAVRTRLHGLRIFRGRAAGVVPSQVVVTAPAYPPASVRIRVRGLRLFRGRSTALVPPQITVVPPSFVPVAVRSRLKWLRWFRPRAATAPVDQAAQPATPRVRAHPMAPRRGHVAMPPIPQPPAPPVRSARPRLKGALRPRRAAVPVPAQAVVIAPPFPPGLTRAKKRLARIFRGAARFVGVAQGPPPTGTSSPNPELTTRAGGADLTTVTRNRDLVTRTNDQDLETQ